MESLGYGKSRKTKENIDFRKKLKESMQDLDINSQEASELKEILEKVDNTNIDGKKQILAITQEEKEKLAEGLGFKGKSSLRKVLNTLKSESKKLEIEDNINTNKGFSVITTPEISKKIDDFFLKNKDFFNIGLNNISKTKELYSKTNNVKIINRGSLSSSESLLFKTNKERLLEKNILNYSKQIDDFSKNKIGTNFSYGDYIKVISEKNESGTKGYLARNDKIGILKGIKPDYWAFGKYQFTVQTLRDYGVYFSKVPTEKQIESFLNNKDLQEKVMYRYTLRNISKFSKNWTYKNNIKSGNKKISEALAAGHLGGYGGTMNYMKNNINKKDWLGTSIGSYVKKFSKYYDNKA